MSLLMMQHYHPQFRSGHVCTHEHAGLRAYIHTHSHQSHALGILKARDQLFKWLYGKKWRLQ